MATQDDIFVNAFERHREITEKSISSIIPDIQKAAELISKALKSDHKILVCGNGGSAADSQHFAAELLCKYKEERKPLPAIALTVNSSVITATGNDYDFEYIFSRQIKALGKAGDILIVLTTSGQSKNIFSAVKEARLQGLNIIALTGEKGVDLKREVDVAIIVPSEETARIQEIHELVYHAWCEYIDSQFSG